MLDYRNILRVASDPHKSMRTMEQELRSSHHTIRKVLDAAEKAGRKFKGSEQLFYPFEKLHIIEHRRNYYHRSTFEKRRTSVLKARVLQACHGVSAHEGEAVSLR